MLRAHRVALRGLFMNVFLAISIHFGLTGPPLNKRLRNFSLSEIFSCSLSKKSVFHVCVSRQIILSRIDPPLENEKSWTFLMTQSFGKKTCFSWVFLGKSSHSESNGPPLKNEKSLTFLITQIFFQVFFRKKRVFYESAFRQIKSFSGGGS